LRKTLPAGECTFRHLTDGTYFVDCAAFGLENGAFGLESVVRISPGTEQGRQSGALSEIRNGVVVQ